MSIRSTTLNNYGTNAITKLIDSRYDVVKAVSEHLDEIAYINEEGINTLVATLNQAKDFSGINVETVYVDTEAEAINAVAWDETTKTLTVPSLKGDKGDKGDTGIQGPIGLQGLRGLPGEAGAKGVKGDTGADGADGRMGETGPKGDDGLDGADLTITSIVPISGGRYTWNFSDDTSFTTEDLRGEKGEQGPQGNEGIKGDSFTRLAEHSTTDPYGRFGKPGNTDIYAVMIEDSATLDEYVGSYLTIQVASGMEVEVYDSNANGIVDNSERLGGKTLAMVEEERDAAILTASLALGTNYSVDTNADRDLLEDLTVDDKVFVVDDGDGKWAQYIVREVVDGLGSTSTFAVIMDEDTYLNANTAASIKTTYESNADTNAYTDAEKTSVDIGTTLTTVATTLPQAINEHEVLINDINQVRTDTNEPTGFIREFPDTMGIIEFSLDGTNVIQIDQNGIYSSRSDGLFASGTTWETAAAARTFAVFPVASQGSYSVYVQGTKFNITTIQTVQVTDTTGLKFIYHDVNGTLMLDTVFDYDYFEDNAITSTIYWNATTQDVINFGDERHGIQMDGFTHRYLHFTGGTKYVSGMEIQGLTASGTTYTQIASGTAYDEDIFMTPAQQTDAPFTYFIGNEWTMDTADTNVALLDTGVAQYNLDTAGSYSLAGLATGEIGVSFVCLTNNKEFPYVKILAQEKYIDLATARADIETAVNNLKLNGLPSPEFLPIAAIMYDSTGAVQTLNDGSLYVDLRTSKLSGTGTSSVQSTTHSDLLSRDAVGSHPADAISFDNTVSGLTATEVQSAIDEVEDRVDTAESKLSGIEVGATADQTDAEIKIAYENNTNTNVFTDVEKTNVADNTTARHTHANKIVLDKFGENVEGKPTYNGNAVDTTIAQRDVYDGLDSTDNTISLSAKQGKVLNDTKQNILTEGAFVDGDKTKLDNAVNTTTANTFTETNTFNGIQANSIEPAKGSVNITSWSFTTTTITITVASHPFVAGNMVAVAGLVADTNAPNGIWKVGSVTATTIVFTANATPTGTPTVSSATVRGTLHINGVLGFDDANRLFTIGTSTSDAVYEFVSPDGTIVGKNSAGEYVKYVDGSMTCFPAPITLGYTTANILGSGINCPLPANFIDTSYRISAIGSQQGTYTYLTSSIVMASSDATSACAIKAYSTTINYTSGDVLTVSNIIVQGRWKH